MRNPLTARRQRDSRPSRASELALAEPAVGSGQERGVLLQGRLALLPGALEAEARAGGASNETELVSLEVGEHVRRLVQAAWDLGGDRTLKGYRLRQWAHTLGYRGHWLTKSPYWSTTLTALRQARHEYQLRRSGKSSDEPTVGHWAYGGSGHRSEGDAWLAEAHRKNRQLVRRTSWEEQ